VQKLLHDLVQTAREVGADHAHLRQAACTAHRKHGPHLNNCIPSCMSPARTTSLGTLECCLVRIAETRTSCWVQEQPSQSRMEILEAPPLALDPRLRMHLLRSFLGLCEGKNWLPSRIHSSSVPCSVPLITTQLRSAKVLQRIMYADDTVSSVSNTQQLCFMIVLCVTAVVSRAP
jgi:hypothetical protein